MSVHELGEKQQKHHFDREIRDMMSVLSRRLAHLHKKPTDQASASNIHDDHEEEDGRGGFGVITMAGSNEGATMRGELGSMSMESHKFGMKERNEQSLPPLRTCLNSNFQGVNNSIMIEGSYSSNDPGIHLDVEDIIYEKKQGEAGLRRHGRKGKQKAHSGSSSTSSSDHST